MTALYPRFSSVLLTATVLAAGAIPAHATNLPDIPADTIAQDVERRYNKDTGRTDYIAKDFDPFEADDSLAGSALLRTGGPAITIDGTDVYGGAFLDISLMYTSDSPDDFDMRGFERAEYMSGKPVAAIKYDSKTLDCSQNTREVVYDDGYYNGDLYGYIAGYYHIYPRYRGHRFFGYDRYRPYRHRYGHWVRDRHYADYGYRRGYRDGYLHRDDRTDRHRDRADRNRDRADRNRDRNRDRADRRRNRNTDQVRVYGNARNVTPGPGHSGAADRRGFDERLRNRPHQPDKNANRYQRPDNTAKRPARRQARDIQNNHRRAQTPARSAPPRAVSPPRPQPQVRAQPRPQVRNTAPTPARNQSRAQHTDQTFSSHNPRNEGKRHMRFFPVATYGYARTDVYTSYRCLKEETLNLHIPAERLDAARFDGLTIMLLDQNGRDVPLFIPPNYIEGFRKAAGYALRPTVKPSSVTSGHSGTITAPPAPSSRTPIIYGDPTPEPPKTYPQPD